MILYIDEYHLLLNEIDMINTSFHNLKDTKYILINM